MLYCVLIVLAKFCSSLANYDFNEPRESVDTQEIWQYRSDDEFIINNYAVTWDQANYICSHTLNATLAYFENQEVIDFLGEYLGDSDMSLNTLWVNLQKKNSIDGQWRTWNDEIADESIFECPYHTPSNLCQNCTESLNCGAIVRMFHFKLCFVKLHCDARRKFICRRSITEVSKSTHLDWIKIGSKLFKIFYERMSYDRAAEACTLYDIDSKLAFIETYHEAYTLGRFLLIGRPSKERVWIGARWGYNAYEFEEELVVLSNTTEASNYPPWLRGKISKPHGCLLLDRHLSNKTYFVESRCSRFHAFMCYKRYQSPPFVEVCSVGNYDWKIYYTAQNWFKASEICQNSHSTGRLPYIESQDMKSIIHVMETSKFDVLYHVWLGAYFKNDVWTWTYNNLVLQEKSVEGFPPWVVNKTYNFKIEQYNSCLNLDREDSLEAMFYGTLCYFPQYFICQYDQGSICNNMTTSTETAADASHATTPVTSVSLKNFITTSSLTITPTITAPTTTIPTTTTPTTTTPTTTTPITTTPITTTTITTTTTTTTTKPSRTEATTEEIGSVFHTTEIIWFKQVTDEAGSYIRAEPKHGDNAFYVTTSATTVNLTNVKTTNPPRTTTTKPIRTKTTTRNKLRNGSVFRTTKAPRVKHFKTPNSSIPSHKVTAKKKSDVRAKPKYRSKNSPKKYTENVQTNFRYTDWPSDNRDYAKDQANLDYLVFT